MTKTIHDGPRHSFGATAIGVALFLATACSSSGGGGGVDLPTLASLGGPVMPKPRVQPVYFKGFPYATDIDTFTARLATSAYWPAVTEEYGVGALTVAPGYAAGVTLPATITENDLPTLLAAALSEGAATLGPARGDTIYALFFDPAANIVIQGMTLCDPGKPSAYHDEWTIGGTQVPVAIIPGCPSFPGQPALSGVDVLTLALSHELVEAATDPLANTQPAFAGIDRAHLLWAIAVNGGEVADLCENEQPLVTTPPDLAYPVQRIWSNKGARAGTGPCVPVPPGEVYFQAAADLPEHGDYLNVDNRTISLPVMNAGIGATAWAQVSFRGGAGAPTDLKAVAFEIDDATSIGTEQPTPVAGKLGQHAMARIATSSLTASGVVPLIVGATSGHGDLHLWVGGVNRR